MSIAANLILAFLSAAGPMTSGPAPLATFQCRTPKAVHLASLRDASTAYGWQSVTIIKAAMEKRIAFLSQTVAPDATFGVWRGDVGLGPRSKGSQAAVDFVKQFASRSYRFGLAAGPVSMDPCGKQKMELTIQGRGRNEMIVAQFNYEDGVLAEVSGVQVDLISGMFPQAAR